MTDKEKDRIIKANIKMAGFISLVKRMREAQQDCIYKSMFSTMGNTNMAAYSAAVTKRKTLEQEVDEWLEKLK